MFTGIVERTGKVDSLRDQPGGRRLVLRLEEPDELPPWQPTELGESISVSGVCLTVVESAHGSRGEGRVAFDVVPETLRLTTLGDLAVGDAVNIERSLAVGDSLGGHFVSGHVDGVGQVRRRHQDGDQVTFEITLAKTLLRQVIRKGSIAVDGISLTVVDAEPNEGYFSFAAIPHTLERTALSGRKDGSRVNIETDPFGKWVLHLFEDLLGGEVDAASLARLLRDHANAAGEPPTETPRRAP